MLQEEPIDVKQMTKNAYKEGYENPVILNAQGGVHSDSMPRVRAFAGYSDKGYGTYTKEKKLKAKAKDFSGDWTKREVSTDMFLDDVIRGFVEGSKDRMEGDDLNPDKVV